MNSDLNLRAERQPAAVGMVGAVADLSRSNAAWMSVRNLHLQLRFSHEKFRYGLRGLGAGVRRASLSDKGRVPLTSTLTWLESEPPRSRP
jgi:hypothetical protein